MGSCAVLEKWENPLLPWDCNKILQGHSLNNAEVCRFGTPPLNYRPLRGRSLTAYRKAFLPAEIEQKERRPPEKSLEAGFFVPFHLLKMLLFYGALTQSSNWPAAGYRLPTGVRCLYRGAGDQRGGVIEPEKSIHTGVGVSTVCPEKESRPVSKSMEKALIVPLFWFATYRNLPPGSIAK